ncbi:PilN domain-containing protein [Candidatus Acidulodesulfobacterium sp. H_13]|uniref:PilN domain-containing protein n=1 Tax=Candidatus Acidulodesulfobacterium sp. H_13 TaxID=3395470 RepID=UPI003AF43BD0
MKDKSRGKTRINLLPTKDKERIAKNRKRLAVLSLIIAYIIFIFLIDIASIIKNNNKRNYVSRLNNQLSLIKTKNMLNETLESAINKRKTLLTSIRKKIVIIDGLKELRTAWNEKISDMVEASPEGVWMDGLLLQNNAIMIDGNSISLNDISIYIDRLKKTGLFVKINLNAVNRKIVEGNTFYSFNLRAVLDLSKNK